MSLFTNIIWRIIDNNIYLTFDDGPCKLVTPKLLALLRIFKIKATFFLIGHKVKELSDIVLEIAEEGHTIGNHSYSHQKMIWKSRDFLKSELENTDEAISKITSKRPTLFRPPYGQFGLQLINAIRTTEHKMVLWNASVKDYNANVTSRQIQLHLQKISPGKIVLLHDGHLNSSYTLRALENSLGKLIDRGFKFDALADDR